VRAARDDRLVLHAAALGESEPIPLARSGGGAFEVVDRPPRAMPVAFEESLLYLGPFAMARNPG